MINFKEEIYELAFGDEAINKEYTDEEVIKQLRFFSDTQLELLEVLKKLMPLCDRDDVRDTWYKDFEKAEQVIDKVECG